MGETADGLAPPRDLTAVEGRVLGCLIEKERATPQNYPLTLNALRLACNQSTNRDPVVDYDDHEVEQALTSLRERGLTRIVYSTSNRASKYRHVLDEQLRVNDAELAVLCVLLLRGPQTQGEIKGRTERLHVFRDLGEVEATLDALAARETGALTRRLERRPGQKDARYVQLLMTVDGATDAAGVGHGDAPAAPFPSPPAPSPTTTPTHDRLRAPLEAQLEPHLEARLEPPAEMAADPSVEAPTAPAPAPHDVAELRAEVARLRDELDVLRRDFEAFRAAFG